MSAPVIVNAAIATIRFLNHTLMTPQYRTIASGAAWLDRSVLGRIRFDGPDAASFLHALVTNDVAGLSPGRGAYAAWLTPQGRMITDLRLLRDEDRVVAEVPEGMAPELVSRFDQLIFSENVRVVDDSEASREIVVFGSKAAHVICAALEGCEPLESELDALPILGHVTWGGVRVVRTDDVPLATYALWLPVEKWEKLEAALHNNGAMNDGSTAAVFEAMRIESGRPRFGVDMTTDTIPLEAGLLDRAISMTKGCYVGQEVIVRILHRGGGRVVKQLVQLLSMPGVTAVPQPGTAVLDERREVGKVTSAAMGPASERVVSLAYVHRDSTEAGRHLTLETGHEVTVGVLPSGVL
jgi:folate-binding protein YgfZ